MAPKIRFDWILDLISMQGCHSIFVNRFWYRDRFRGSFDLFGKGSLICS